MATYSAYNAAQFQAALSRAVGGDRILLAPGDYGKVSITAKNYSSAVTVQSMSWGDKAHFDGLTVRNSANILFNGLDMGRGREAGDAEFSHINFVGNSRNIRFNNSVFHGDGVGGPQNDLQGLSIYDSTNVSVTYSEFVDLARGVYVLRSNNTNLQGNDFHDIRLDGVAVAAAHGINLQANLFRDFHPMVGDHADAIQFWNTGQTRGSANVAIKNNVIWLPEDYAGVDQGVQGIWIADPGTLGYRNITIQNNLVYAQDRWNGISVIGGNGVNILNNSLMSSSGDAEHLWVRLEGNSNVTLRNNVSEGQLLRNNANLVHSNNIDLFRTPHLRDLFGDIDDPQIIADLITPGVGFQPIKLPFSLGNAPMLQTVAGALDTGDTQQSESFDVVEFEPAPMFEDVAVFEEVSAPVVADIGRAFMFTTEHFTALP